MFLIYLYNDCFYKFDFLSLNFNMVYLSKYVETRRKLYLLNHRFLRDKFIYSFFYKSKKVLAQGLFRTNSGIWVVRYDVVSRVNLKITNVFNTSCNIFSLNCFQEI